LAAIGRVCQPTSKRSRHEGCVIPCIEQDIVANLLEKEKIALDVLLCDTTNVNKRTTRNGKDSIGKSKVV
jgi:hypothetical protein